MKQKTAVFKAEIKLLEKSLSKLNKKSGGKRHSCWMGTFNNPATEAHMALADHPNIKKCTKSLLPNGTVSPTELHIFSTLTNKDVCSYMIYGKEHFSQVDSIWADPDLNRGPPWNLGYIMSVIKYMKEEDEDDHIEERESFLDLWIVADVQRNTVRYQHALANVKLIRKYVEAGEAKTPHLQIFF